MGFGDSVNTLLGTYSNCLKLLKAFGGTRGDGDSLSGDTLLRKSIKADRAKVQRAYSSRRSQAGRRFEKGDGEILLISLSHDAMLTWTFGQAQQGLRYAASSRD